jgi:hypothetical protein
LKTQVAQDRHEASNMDSPVQESGADTIRAASHRK